MCSMAIIRGCWCCLICPKHVEGHQGENRSCKLTRRHHWRVLQLRGSPTAVMVVCRWQGVRRWACCVTRSSNY